MALYGILRSAGSERALRDSSTYEEAMDFRIPQQTIGCATWNETISETTGLHFENLACSTRDHTLRIPVEAQKMHRFTSFPQYWARSKSTC